MPGVPPRMRHLAGADTRVQDVGEALAEGTQVLADHGQVVLTGDEGTFLTGKTDVARRERDVRDARRLGLEDCLCEADPDVGIADDEVDPPLDEEPDVVLGDGRIEVRSVEVGFGGDDGPDLLVGERLEDRLHVAHRTPDVHRVAAAVGVAHHDLATGAGVALLAAPTLHRLVDRGLIEVLIGPRDGGQDDVPARLVRRLHRAEGLVDQCRVGIGALPELRQTAGPRAPSVGAVGGVSSGSSRHRRRHMPLRPTPARR